MKRMARRSDLPMLEALPTRSDPPVQSTGGLPALGVPLDGPEQGNSLWSMLDDRMRGRWRWAILLALLLSIGLGSIGYATARPTYRSVGAVQVLPFVSAVLQRSDMHEQPHYEAFRSDQMKALKNPRVLEQALKDPEVAKLEWSKRPDAAADLRRNLQVERDREGTYILVWFEAEDPVVAQAVTNAVLRAYDDIFGRYDGQDVPGTLAELRANEATHVRTLNMLQEARRAIDQRHQASDLVAAQQHNMQQIGELESLIRTARRELQRNAQQNGQGNQTTEIIPDHALLESMYPILARRRVEWQEAQVTFDNFKASHTPAHPGYANAEVKAARAKDLYDIEYRNSLEAWKLDGRRLPAGVAKAYTAEDVEGMERELEQLRERQTALVADVAKREDLLLQEQATQHQLDLVRNRLNSLELESSRLRGFIRIAQWGARDDVPYENAQRKRAIMGVGLGLMASFGGFFLLGSVDRRAFGASQLQPKPGSAAPVCLGVLPDLGASLSDPESSDIATHCVHQIRNQIEALREPHNGYVLAITSPFQGDGKTSIVMALGWSYAAAGYNTLLIDCDFVGRSLTRQLGLVGREGLKDALAVQELNGSVSRMGIENLSAVPAGIHQHFGPENVRRIDLDRLLDQVREKFDIIIVDTGPLFGSLESTPVTTVADGVLLSVRRGRSRSRLEECVNRLEMLGGNCLGVVLNCAGRSDCYRYVSDASLAAAEEERVVRGGASKADSPDPAPPASERNALVRAMQTSNKVHRILK